MNEDFERLKGWVDQIADLIQNSVEPGSEQMLSFVHEPELAIKIIELLNSLDEDDIESERSYYSACIYALDICVAQLQTSVENSSKVAQKVLENLMIKLSQTLLEYKHSLSFWLPILNAFYNVHVELSPVLKNAYIELANQEESSELDEEDHLNAIRDMVIELSDLSTFDIAENFFAQSYAMPAEFFIELTVDLFDIDEGQDIALLSLLHPKEEVRELLLPIFEDILKSVNLSSRSLSRLQAIRAWYPQAWQAQISHLIKYQRMKGVVFAIDSEPVKIKKLYATEIDGRGSQGIFLHLKIKGTNRLCGILLSDKQGIKDVWVTPPLEDSLRYYFDNFDTTLTLREVPLEYIELIVNHFLALTINQASIPDLHLLEIQEFIGLAFQPQALDIEAQMASLDAELTLSDSDLASSFKRSKSWLNSKSFTETWFIESTNIDKLVNIYSSFQNGVRVCKIDEAIAAVFKEEMEAQRDKWLFHFLWLSLWLKAKHRKSEKAWQDSFIIAKAIHEGRPLAEIPVLQEICYQSIVNSVETMNERRTYLHRR